MQAPNEKVINRAYHILNEKIANVEYLTGYEGNAFTGNAEEDILSITAVHPMRHDAVDSFLKRAGVDWKVIQNLVKEERLIQTEYDGNIFYLRRFRKKTT